MSDDLDTAGRSTDSIHLAVNTSKCFLDQDPLRVRVVVRRPRAGVGPQIEAFHVDRLPRHDTLPQQLPHLRVQRRLAVVHLVPATPCAEKNKEMWVVKHRPGRPSSPSYLAACAVNA